VLAERTLRAALRTIALVRVEGPFHRFVELGRVLDTLATGQRLLIPMGAYAVGGRFTPPRRFPTLYVAREATTALHEAEGELPDAVQRAYTHFAVRGVLIDVLDLTARTTLEGLELTEAEVRAPWRWSQGLGREASTQTLGRLAHASRRIQGILYPSTMQSGGQCVAIFPARVATPSDLAIADDTGVLSDHLP